MRVPRLFVAMDAVENGWTRAWFSKTRRIYRALDHYLWYFTVVLSYYRQYDATAAVVLHCTLVTFCIISSRWVHYLRLLSRTKITANSFDIASTSLYVYDCPQTFFAGMSGRWIKCPTSKYDLMPISLKRRHLPSPVYFDMIAGWPQGARSRFFLVKGSAAGTFWSSQERKNLVSLWPNI